MNLELKKEQYVKLFFAVWIVLSHLPCIKILSVYNYLPVAGFFFLSGYGLMEKNKKKLKYNFKKSFIKIYIPYIISTILFTLFFDKYSLLKFVNQILLIEITLPYGWYIRAQIIIYFIWYFAEKTKNNYSKVLVTFFLLIIYATIFKITGQILTSYKTVFAFVFGLIYSLDEEILCKFINKYSFVLCGIISLILRLFVSSNETILDVILYNLSGIIFCVSVVYIIYNLKINNEIFDKIQKISFEIYLVQGISQCFVMKTDFCDKSYLYLDNNVLIVALCVIITLFTGFLLNKIDGYIFKIIYRRKEI